MCECPVVVMVNIRTFYGIFFLLVGCLGNDEVIDENKVNNSDLSAFGVVFEWTPEGTEYKDTDWFWYLSEVKWSEALNEKFLNYECFEYAYVMDDSGKTMFLYRVRVMSIIEYYEIENFAVTSCDSETLSLEATTSTAFQDGYDYTLTFRDHRGTCYRRRYIIETTDLTAHLLRYDVEQIKCTKQLNSGADKRILITDWSTTGTYEKTYSMLDSPYKVSEITVPGPCESVYVYCMAHHFVPFDWDNYILVADIEANDIRLDRVRVTSCTEFSLKASFKCESNQCIGQKCTLKMVFMKPDGTCVKRTYKTVKYEDNHKNTDYITIEKGRVEDWACGNRMTIRASFRKFGRNITAKLKEN